MMNRVNQNKMTNSFRLEPKSRCALFEHGAVIWGLVSPCRTLVAGVDHLSLAPRKRSTNSPWGELDDRGRLGTSQLLRAIAARSGRYHSWSPRGARCVASDRPGAYVIPERMPLDGDAYGPARYRILWASTAASRRPSSSPTSSAFSPRSGTRFTDIEGMVGQESASPFRNDHREHVAAVQKSAVNLSLA